MTDINNRPDIETLMNHFYAQALGDSIIGHFFTQVVKLDLDTHLPVIADFWESILLDSSHYRGNPMQKHLDLNAMSTMTAAHFERWLQLFNQSVDNLFKGPRADLAKTRALSMATMMQIKIAQQATGQ